jgi:hypothetical protein
MDRDGLFFHGPHSGVCCRIFYRYASRDYDKIDSPFAQKIQGRTMRAISFLLLLLLSPGYAAAVYTCTGSSGEPLFSDQPCWADGSGADFSSLSISGPDVRYRTRPKPIPRDIRQKRVVRPVSPGVTNPSKKARKAAKCLAIKRQLESIQSRLRAGGYSVPEGNRLRARRRQLQEEGFRKCR